MSTPGTNVGGPGNTEELVIGAKAALHTTQPSRIVRVGDQFIGKDKVMAMASAGQINVAEAREDHIFIQGDATAAYRTTSPEIRSVTRDVYFVRGQYFVIVDNIDASEPVEIDWLLHANAPMTLGDSTFRYAGERAGFPGVDSAEIEGLPVSTCLTATFPKATRHRIAMLLVPYPNSDPRRVFSFLDDQGYDCDLYFTDASDQSFKVIVPKTFDVGA